MRRLSSLLSTAFVVVTVLTSTHAWAQSTSGDVKRSWEHLQTASSAASAGQWDKALDEYKASNQIASSVVALEGIANANYQLGRDQDALAAYRELLALNPEIPADKPDIKREWDRVRLGAEQRVRALEARAQKTSAAAPKATEPKSSQTAENVAPGTDDDVSSAERNKPAADKSENTEVRTAKNALFAELLGNGLVYSINYERLFESPDIGLRVGASYMSLGASGGGGSSSVSWLSVPVVGSYYAGGENHKLQLGVGVTFVYIATAAQSGSLVGSASGLVPMPTAVLGYRYIPAKGGFGFSVGFTPIFVTGKGGGFLPWGGLSLGAVF